MKMTQKINLDLDYYKALRHELHAMPELGYQEHRTAARICRELERYGIPYEEGIGGTGIVAWIDKGSAGRSIGLRADMDALPISEETGLPYASRNEGVMHACGHDGHVTMLLAAAKVLKDSVAFDGRVVLVFQPAEEGGAGAKAMIEDGLFDRFPMERIYGLHTRPSEAFGTFLIKEGPVMTSVDTWEVVVRGRSGHSSQPHHAVNPILAVSHLVQGIKEISATSIDPAQAHVITVATIEGGVAFNVIPETCRIGGSVRAFSREVQETVERRIRELADGMAQGFGAEAAVEYQYRYPPTVNTHIESAYRAAVACVGEAKIKSTFPSSMGSEDFSFYLERVPGAYVWLGSKVDPEAETVPLHSSRYDFNDDLIEIGVCYWTGLVREELGA
ncbi:M20 aminoacylase family protein [Nitratifractor sp.]|uniref:M20 aminoacylase family protein n=1 Tax=Nitratifractor sp. TaxID=2268144 RepID=UPI0025DBF26C|nr:M20 aminoacylase family protein [Nitratifractor sp.]